MSEKLKAFFKKLMEDQAFREQFSSAKTAKEGYEKARPYIGEASFNEFKEALTYVHNKIEYRKKLLKSDLRSISGGATEFADVVALLTKFNGRMETSFLDGANR